MKIVQFTLENKRALIKAGDHIMASADANVSEVEHQKVYIVKSVQEYKEGDCYTYVVGCEETPNKST